MLTQAEIKTIIEMINLKDHGGRPDWSLSFLDGDGSQRKFVRVHHGSGVQMLAVLPSLDHPAGMGEARACYRIGMHLYSKGVPVPEIFGFDESTGAVFMEDLGDVKLQDVATGLAQEDFDITRCYHEAIMALVKLQVGARDGFDPVYCWDTRQYDENVMIEKESGYFFREFWQGLLGGGDCPAGLRDEFTLLARRAGQEPSGFILHRDFQSRNLMVCDGRVRIIDFQGARLGPLGYDIASLLIDPYTALSKKAQDDLLSFYLSVLDSYILLDRSRFLEGYTFLALQRNLQILGAFSFLSRKKGKLFFRPFIRPAAQSLHGLLTTPGGSLFPRLRKLSEESLSLLDKRLKSE